MSEHDTNRNVLRDLLADRATQGLSAAEQQQLETLLAGDLQQADAVDLAAAALQVAEIVPDEPLPADLRQKVAQQAQTFLEQHSPIRRQSQGSAFRSLSVFWSWSGWAAAVLVLVFAVIRDDRKRPQPPSASEQRQSLLAEPDTLRLKWSTTQDPSSSRLTGDIVWNERDQRGYMTFQHLASNDPRVSTYQLWIFAANQDERYPVDGATFNVPAGLGYVIVPITPRVHVSGAKLFAVTEERQGGVVVSKRQRIVSVAKVS